MDYQEIIVTALHQIKETRDNGKIATYISELAGISPDKFGVHMTTLTGFNYGQGDNQEKFSIQSVAKVLSLSLAYSIVGEKNWERVDVKPSGTK